MELSRVVRASCRVPPNEKGRLGRSPRRPCAKSDGLRAASGDLTFELAIRECSARGQPRRTLVCTRRATAKRLSVAQLAGIGVQARHDRFGFGCRSVRVSTLTIEREIGFTRARVCSKGKVRKSEKAENIGK